MLILINRKKLFHYIDKTIMKLFIMIVVNVIKTPSKYHKIIKVKNTIIKLKSYKM